MKSPIPCVCGVFHRPGHAGPWAQLLHAVSLSLLGGRPTASSLLCVQGNTLSTEPENQHQFEETYFLPNRKDPVTYQILQKRYVRYTDIPRTSSVKSTKDVHCLLCCMSEQQGTPRDGSLQGTAEEYRQRLLNIMRSVWKKIQENKRNLNRETNKIRTWDSYMSTWKKTKQTEYWKVFHLVYHEEKHHLEKTEEESKEIFQQLKESQYNMDLKQKLLRQIYEELKELCHKPDMELI